MKGFKEESVYKRHLVTRDHIFREEEKEVVKTSE
jgi:hypothetical protein